MGRPWGEKVYYSSIKKGMRNHRSGNIQVMQSEKAFHYRVARWNKARAGQRMRLVKAWADRILRKANGHADQT